MLAKAAKLSDSDARHDGLDDRQFGHDGPACGPNGRADVVQAMPLRSDDHLQRAAAIARESRFQDSIDSCRDGYNG